MLPAACIPALISLYTIQAYESTEIKHAFVVRMQAPRIVHQGHCILRVCIHYSRKGTASELEPKALQSTVIKKGLALPVIIFIIIIITIIVVLLVTIITERLTLQVTITTKSLTRQVKITTEGLTRQITIITERCTLQVTIITERFTLQVTIFYRTP